MKHFIFSVFIVQQKHWPVFFSSDDLKAILSQPETRIRITFGTLFFLCETCFRPGFCVTMIGTLRWNFIASDVRERILTRVLGFPSPRLESSMMHHLRVDFVFLPFHPFLVALFNAKWNPSLWHHRKNLFLHILAHSPNMFPLITQNSFSNEKQKSRFGASERSKKSFDFAFSSI